MPIVRLGNVAPLDNGRPIPGPQITTVQVPDSYTDEEAFVVIVHQDGTWPAHSASPPAWVESDHSELEARLAAHYRCPVGQTFDPAAPDSGDVPLSPTSPDQVPPPVAPQNGAN